MKGSSGISVDVSFPESFRGPIACDKSHAWHTNGWVPRPAVVKFRFSCCLGSLMCSPLNGEWQPPPLWRIVLYSGSVPASVADNGVLFVALGPSDPEASAAALADAWGESGRSALEPADSGEK